ncbi:hypothetical protein ACFLT9_10215, partial [Acidobacteriota bacterium]
MKKTISIVLVLFLALSIHAQQTEEKTEFSTYAEMRKKVVALYQQEQFEKAALILKAALVQFPDHLKANVFNLALMYTHLQEPGMALKALNYAQDRGLWFGKYTFFNPLWKPLKEHPDFESFNSKNEAIRFELQKTIKPKLEVFVPEGFTPEKKYPLYIALHGGGENIEVFKPRWTSSLMKKEFIVAYPQSSQLVDENGFNWTEDMS